MKSAYSKGISDSSASFGLPLFLDRERCTYLPPAPYNYQRWYYNPPAVCKDVIGIIVIHACSKVISIKKRSYEIHSCSIKLPQRNDDLKNVAVWLFCGNSISARSEQSGQVRLYIGESE